MADDLRRGKTTPTRSAATPSTAITKNRLLATLPDGAITALERHMHPVQLEWKEVLFRAHEPLATVYFPTSAVISFVAHLESGEALEVGLVGRDGLVGTSVFPGIFHDVVRWHGAGARLGLPSGG